MGMVKSFLDANPNAGVLYFESESAITKQMVIDRGIDPNRMVILPVTTVQDTLEHKQFVYWMIT